MKWLIVVPALFGFLAACSTVTTAPVSSPLHSPSPLPSSLPILHGITLDSVKNTSAITDALVKMPPARPAVRIVFDEGVSPKSYEKAIREIHPYAEIMGEILDSEFVDKCNLDCYKKRTVDALTLPIDLFEVGNEINGEWVGDGAVDKLTASFDLVRAAGRLSAMTLYWNGPADDGSASCWSDKPNQALLWADRLPERLKLELDYVFLSFYEDDCPLAKPDWMSVFTELHKIFPHSLLGFGEVGTKFAAKKAELIKRYYSMRLPGTFFIGGWFYWTGYEDFVLNKDPTLFNILSESFQ